MYLIFSDGSKVKIPNQFLVAAHKRKYLKMSATFVGDEGKIEAPFLDVCDKCHKNFDELVKPDRFLSEDTELNRSLNRPGRICIICYYKPYYDAGHIIPAPIRRLF